MTAQERDHFANYSNHELIKTFNKQVGNAGWVSSRGMYIRALYDEFVKRGFDLTEIGGAGELSLHSRIKLHGRKIVAAEE